MPPKENSGIWLSLYELAWKAVLPALFHAPRLREGWSERLLRSGPRDRVDLWIQAASGGEAYLALHLEAALSKRKSIRGLVTSGTGQGLRILQESPGSDDFHAAFFPFDLPTLMKRALEQWRPRVMVLLETELWPGLLSACRRMDIPVLILNGRLSRKGLKFYLRSKRFWRGVAPTEIHAISREDAGRFAEIFGADRVQVMNNIKFDRLALDSSPSLSCFLGDLLAKENPFLVLGSVRKEEEGEIKEVLKGVFSRSPQAVIGLFPRHMHRLPAWRESLDRMGLSWVWRSQVREPVSPGTVILWDRFGELEKAYGRAWSVFVGGSLKPCGGQNFLEALGRGVVPCIGPHWENFAWVGREIVQMGLVKEVAHGKELARALSFDLLNPPKREETIERLRSYLDQRVGGTEQSCKAVERYLSQGGPA
jgi:3-deoxy-D-manno-octulosonic-acid transferase